MFFHYLNGVPVPEELQGIYLMNELPRKSSENYKIVIASLVGREVKIGDVLRFLKELQWWFIFTLQLFCSKR